MLGFGRVAWLIVTVCCLAGCHQQDPPTLRNCATADECFQIRLDYSGICKFPATGIDTAAYWDAFDFHASRNILAVVERQIVHLNTNLPDSITYIPVRVVAQPKVSPPVMGGPDHQDVAGPARTLGCEYQSIPNNLIDQYIYSKYSVCFEDDPTCNNNPPPAPTESQIALCERACAAKPMGCTDAHIASPEMSRFASAAISAPLPTSERIASLVRVLGQSQRCANPGDMQVDGERNVLIVGQECTVGIPLGDTSPWYAAVLNAPTTARGKLTRATSPQSEATIVWDPSATMMIRTYASQAANPVSERLTAIRAKPNELLFAAEGNFCARVTF